MKWLFFILLTGCCLRSFSQPAATVDTAAESKQVSEIISRFASTWNRHDVKAFSMVFAEDADFTNVVGVGGHGRAALESFYEKPFRTWFRNSHFSVVRQKIRFIRADVAAVDAWWEMSGVVDAQGRKKSLRKGLLNFVIVRDNGSWLINVMHNLDLAED